MHQTTLIILCAVILIHLCESAGGQNPEYTGQHYAISSVKYFVEVCQTCFMPLNISVFCVDILTWIFQQFLCS